MKEIEKEKLWHKRYYQICLHNEIYPNREILRDFLIVTPAELKRLNTLTDNRIKLYNKKYRKKGYARYEL